MTKQPKIRIDKKLCAAQAKRIKVWPCFSRSTLFQWLPSTYYYYSPFQDTLLTTTTTTIVIFMAPLILPPFLGPANYLGTWYYIEDYLHFQNPRLVPTPITTMTDKQLTNRHSPGHLPRPITNHTYQMQPISSFAANTDQITNTSTILPQWPDTFNTRAICWLSGYVAIQATSSKIIQAHNHQEL